MHAARGVKERKLSHKIKTYSLHNKYVKKLKK